VAHVYAKFDDGARVFLFTRDVPRAEIQSSSLRRCFLGRNPARFAEEVLLVLKHSAFR